MYTIFGHLGFKKSEVKWSVPGTPTAAPSAAPVPKNPLNQAKELLKKIRESNFIKSGELKEFKELLKQAGKANENKNQELKGILMAELSKPTRTQEEWDARNYENPTEGDKKDIKALLTAWENDFKEVDDTQKTKTLEVKNVVEKKEIELKINVKSVIGQKEQSDALAQILKIDEQSPNASIYKNLKDANIVSLLTVLRTKNEGALNEYVSKYNGTGRPEGWDIYKGLRDLGYSSNGTLGPSEAGAVKNFIEYYTKLDPRLKGKINQIAEFAQVGLATTVARSSLSRETRDKIKDLDTTLSYLSTLPDARFKAADILKVLTSLKDDPRLLPRLAILCGIQGTAPTNINDFITVLEDKPEMKARFFENINTAGAGQTVSLRGIILGEGAKQATEKSEKIERIISTLASKSLDELRSKVEKEADPTKKAQMEKLLAEYDKKGSAWFTGEIKKVAEGAFVNIGKGTNAIGGGVSFEAFISGLTVSLGASYGPDNKFNPALVVHYDIASGKLTETEKMIIEGSLGAGTSIFPAVVPFVDGSLKATDKLQVYGNGVGNVDSKGVSVMGTKGGAILSLNFLNERKSEIDQGMVLMNSLIGDFAKLKGGDITKDKIEKIVSAKKGMTITPDEAEYWAKRLTELYRVNGVDNNTSEGAKELLIKGVVESEGEKKHTQEAMNDTDARSYKGFSVGVGHLFGVTFPLVGLYFKEGRIQYQYPKEFQTREVTREEEVSITTPAIPETTENQVVGQSEVGVQNALQTRDEITEQSKQLAISIYDMSRRKTDFPAFDRALINISNGDYSNALKELGTMKKSTVAKALVKYVGDNPEKLAIINTFTYGGSPSMKKESISKAEYKKERTKGVIDAETRLGGAPQDGSEVFFESLEKHSPKHISDMYKGQLVSSSVFATPKGGTHRIDKYPGSVLISESTFEVRDYQKNRLIEEHASSYQKIVDAINEQFTGLNPKMTVKDYKGILLTGEIPQTLSSSGLKFQEGKGPKFIEGRAMVQGNLCANRTEAIIHPLFDGPKVVTVPGKPPGIQITTQNKTIPPQFDIHGARTIVSEVQSGLVATAIGPKQEPDTEQRNFRTEIRTEDIQVGPNNITIVDGSRVITVTSGGTQTNIALSTLTREQAQAVIKALETQQSTTISLQVSVQVPVIAIVPGATHPIPHQVAYDINITTSQLSNMDRFNYSKDTHGSIKRYIQYLLDEENFTFAQEPR